MFSLALALGAGILFADFCWRPPMWLAIGATVFWVSAAILVSHRPRLAWLIAHGAVIVLGWVALVGQSGQGAADKNQQDLSAFLGGQEITVIGYVVREPGFLLPGSASPDHIQLDVATESLANETHKITTAAVLRLNIYKHGDELEYAEGAANAQGVGNELRYGDRLQLTAKLRSPKNFRNPGALDYEAYIRRQGVTALGSCKSDSVQKLPGNGGDKLSELRYGAKRSALTKIHQLWPERQASLMDAMLIGERAFIERELTTDFQRSGTFHILVVSGMNLGILAFVVFWSLRRLRMSEVLASLLTVLLALGYALLCDGGAPIVRSALMLALYLIARLIYRGKSPLNAVGTAAAFILLLDPAALFDTSFQLTFLCVVAIAGIGAPLLERTSEPWRKGLLNFDSTAFDLSLPPKVAQFRLDLRLIINRLGKLTPEPLAKFLVMNGVRVTLGTFDVLVMSALMQVAMVLPMATYFHRATLVALPANALVIPLAGILMPAAAAALALAYLSATLAIIPAVIAAWSLDLITGTVRIFGALRVADARLPTPGLVAILICVAAGVYAMFVARRKRIWVATSLLLLLSSALYLMMAPVHPQVRAGVLEVTGIDVGQADSTLLVAPDGRALLVDAAGPLGFSRSQFDYGENVVSPYLWSRGFSRLDVAVVTHGHSDHIGGMMSVINNFRPRELWVGPLPDTAAIRSLLTRAREVGVNIVSLRAGDEFGWAGTQIRVLSPPQDYELSEYVRNNDSLVLQVQFQATAALLEGDAEKKMERLFANDMPQTTLLKVAHNGSLTSTTPELLEAARPRYALISVGAGNTFHHPRPEILSRLAERHIATYRTDTMGMLTFILDGKHVASVTNFPYVRHKP